MMFSKGKSQQVSVSLVVLTIGTLSIATASAGAAVSLTRGTVKPVWKDGTIHQCVNDTTYATRTLPRGKRCTARETGFTFDQTGRAGLSASAFSDDHAVPAMTVPAGDKVFTAKKTTITLSKPGKILVLNATLYGATFNNQSNAAVNYIEVVLVDKTSVPGALPTSPQVQVPPETTSTVNGFSTPPGSLAVGAGKHTVQIAFISSTTTNYLTSASGSLLAVATG